MSPDYWFVFWRAMLANLVGLTAPFVTALALAGIRWDSGPSKGTYDSVDAIRGDLPPWAWQWYSTPDERLPGNLGEPGQHRAWLEVGRVFAAWNWVGLRNRAHGFAFNRWARPLVQPWPAEPGYYEDDRGLWWLRRPILGGRFAFKAGWRHYRVNGKWFGVPCFTITRP